MKKKLFFVLLLIVLYSCSGGFIREPKEEMKDLNLNEFGLLVFSITFMENVIQENDLYINLTGEVGGNKELRIKPGEEKIFVFFVKKGVYSLANLSGENNCPAVTRAGSSKEFKDIYTDKVWSFKVEAGKLNYIGNILIKDFSDKPERYNTLFTVRLDGYKLSAQIEIRNKITDISATLEQYPFLKNYKMPVQVSLMQEGEEKKKELSAGYQQQKESQNKGYGNYAWGSSVEEVKKMLELENKKIYIKNNSHLVDTTSPEKPVEFIFENQSGELLLSKVIVHYAKTDYDKVFGALKARYGDFAKKDQNTIIWYTPHTKISLTETDSKTLLFYEAINLKPNEKQDVLIK